MGFPPQNARDETLTGGCTQTADRANIPSWLEGLKKLEEFADVEQLA
jgi:hypothetical protein